MYIIYGNIYKLYKINNQEIIISLKQLLNIYLQLYIFILFILLYIHFLL